MNTKKRKLKSNDGEIFEIEESCLQLVQYFKNLSKDYPNPKKEILLNSINWKTLDKIIDYLKHYQNEKPKEIKKKNILYDELIEFLDEWDYNFIIVLPYDDCIDLLNGAKILEIKELVDLVSTKIASETLTIEINAKNYTNRHDIVDDIANKLDIKWIDKNANAFIDWMRDLGWIDPKIVKIIINIILPKHKPRKKIKNLDDLIETFNEIIIPEQTTRKLEVNWINLE